MGLTMDMLRYKERILALLGYVVMSDWINFYEVYYEIWVDETYDASHFNTRASEGLDTDWDDERHMDFLKGREAQYLCLDVDWQALIRAYL
jgi:hypothetical protein